MTMSNMLRQTLLTGKLFAKVAFRDARSGFNKFSEAGHTNIQKAEEESSFMKLTIVNGALSTLLVMTSFSIVILKGSSVSCGLHQNLGSPSGTFMVIWKGCQATVFKAL